MQQKPNDQVSELNLPKDLEFLEGITVEQVKSTMDTFTQRIVEKIINSTKHQEIIIPSQGSLYIYYKIIEALKLKDPTDVYVWLPCTNMPCTNYISLQGFHHWDFTKAGYKVFKSDPIFKNLPDPSTYYYTTYFFQTLFQTLLQN